MKDGGKGDSPNSAAHSNLNPLTADVRYHADVRYKHEGTRTNDGGERRTSQGHPSDPLHRPIPPILINSNLLPDASHVPSPASAGVPPPPTPLGARMLFKESTIPKLGEAYIDVRAELHVFVHTIHGFTHKQHERKDKCFVDTARPDITDAQVRVVSTIHAASGVINILDVSARAEIGLVVTSVIATIHMLVEGGANIMVGISPSADDVCIGVDSWPFATACVF